jgi:hypothetical protein
MITKSEVDKEPPEVLRSCHDCKFLVGYVNLWCKNEKAVKARGTAIPGVIHCPYWQSERAKLKPSKNNKMKRGFWLYFTLSSLAFIGLFLLMESGASNWRALVAAVCFIAMGAIAAKYRAWEV